MPECLSPLLAFDWFPSASVNSNSIACVSAGLRVDSSCDRERSTPHFPGWGDGEDAWDFCNAEHHYLPGTTSQITVPVLYVLGMCIGLILGLLLLVSNTLFLPPSHTNEKKKKNHLHDVLLFTVNIYLNFSVVEMWLNSLCELQASIALRARVATCETNPPDVAFSDGC